MHTHAAQPDRGETLSRFINSIVLGLVSFIVLLSIFWYVVEVRHENSVTIASVEPTWGASDPRTTTMDWEFKFQNTHKSLVQLVRIEYELGIDDFLLAEETRNVTLRIPAEGSAATTINTPFPTSFFASWMKAHADGGEESWITLRGDAILQINQVRVEVPFDVKRTWKSTMAADVAGALKNCDQTNGTVCLSGAETEWDTSRSAAIDARVFLQNPSEGPAFVRDLRITLMLHALPVAAGSVAGPIELPADQATPVVVSLRFDPEEMVRWWPKHVETCETSPMFLRAEFTYGSDGGNSTARITQEFPAPAFESRFVCEAG